MKIGLRKPSLKKSIAARMSVKKKIAPRMPRGMGILRDPEKAVYNKVYNMTSVSAMDIIKRTKNKSEEAEPEKDTESPGSATMGFIILGVIIVVIVLIVKIIL